jgi:prepilin-type processing-associated H-X9-DG protein
MCLSNTKQEAIGVLMYANDNDETFPLAFGYYPGTGWMYNYPHVVPYDWIPGSGPNWKAMNAVFWANSVTPYLKSGDIHGCPSGEIMQHPSFESSYAAPAQRPSPVTYTYNGLLMAYAEAGVKATATVPLLWEGRGKARMMGVGLANPMLWCQDPNAPCRYVPPASGCYSSGNGAVDFPGRDSQYPDFDLQFFYRTLWIHTGGMNMSMADGHAKWHRVGATTNTDTYNPTNYTDRRVDPFPAYDTNGFPIWWASWTSDDDPDGCHSWFFRPDIERE